MHERIYYWPSSYERPYYYGIIDGAEFTNYDYYIEPDEWIIMEDPTEMARRYIDILLLNWEVYDGL